MTEQISQDPDQAQDPDDTADVEEESGAGYGNHGDAGPGSSTSADQDGQAGVSGGMSDTDRG